MQPAWGGWAGRYGPNTNYAGVSAFWANQTDRWNGTTNRDNTVRRWAVHLQNDFKARLDWCVKDFAQANHPPVARVRGELRRIVRSHEVVQLDAGESSDPDGQPLRFEWIYYSEPGNYRGAPVEIRDASSARASFITPAMKGGQTIHIILAVTDAGEPALTRYQRITCTVRPP